MANSHSNPRLLSGTCPRTKKAGLFVFKVKQTPATGIQTLAPDQSKASVLTIESEGCAATSEKLVLLIEARLEFVLH